MTSSLSSSWLLPRCSPNTRPLPALPRWAPKSNREPFEAIKLQLIGEKEASGRLILLSFDPNHCNNLTCWTISTVGQWTVGSAPHWDKFDLTINRTEKPLIPPTSHTEHNLLPLAATRRRSWCCQSRFPVKVFYCAAPTASTSPPNQ